MAYEDIKDKGFDSRTTEERQELARKAGKASGEARRKKKSMRETAKQILEMQVVGDANRRNLDNFGIDKDDQNYQTAIVVRLMQKALIEGDTAAIKLIGDLTGELNVEGYLDSDIIDMEMPQVIIPDNGRDKKKRGNVIAPQAGPQTQFMTSDADIVIYGGAAGGGKTYALLLEGLRHKDVKGFGGVIFRSNYTQVTAEGGLWDASHKIYDMVPDASAGKTPKLHWDFATGGKLTFAHLGGEDALSSWQGTEICYLGFDELTHFTKKMFLYMLSRNRSTCGIKPYVRATCNPDADSFVADLIKWWIDQDTGYPIPERSGQIRWMCVLNDEIYIEATPEALVEKYKDYDVSIEDCKSFTFIASRLDDNKILMESDPGYLANLKSLMEIDRERLLMGNWKIKANAGMYFKRTQVEIVSIAPPDIVAYCRGWDLAATESDGKGDPDWTAGVLVGKRQNGQYIVLDVVHERMNAGDVEKLVINTSKMDRGKYGYNYTVRMARDPGQAGKQQANQYVNLLAGFDIRCKQITGSKETRATPFAAQWQNGFVQVLESSWNDAYLVELESFPESKHDDMVDASSDAFSELAEDNFDIKNLL